jgi:hypothetical protein
MGSDAAAITFVIALNGGKIQAGKLQRDVSVHQMIIGGEASNQFLQFITESAFISDKAPPYYLSCDYGIEQCLRCVILSCQNQ